MGIQNLILFAKSSDEGRWVDPLLRLSADKVIELLEARNWSSERIEGGVEGQSGHCREDYTKLQGGTSRQ